MAGRPVGFFLQAVAVFLLAIVLARLTLDRENGWVFFTIIVPLLFIVLAVMAGWVRALGLTLFFAILFGSLRLVLSTPRLGWSILLLLALFAASVFLVSRVAVRLWRDRQERLRPDSRNQAGPRNKRRCAGWFASRPFRETKKVGEREEGNPGK